MNSSSPRLPLCLLCLLLADQTLSRPDAAAPEHPDVEEEKTVSDEITQPLQQRIESRKNLGSVRIEVSWLRDGNMVSAALYGTGAGIWNDRTQFPISSTDLLRFLESVRDSRFGAMGRRYGEGDRLRLRGKMTLAIGPVSKSVVQLVGGEQSEELDALANRILDFAERRGEGGVSASSLDESLRKIEAGRLAPEAFRLTALRRDDRPDSTKAEDGWLLRVEGREAVARPFRSQAGYGSPRRMSLSEKELVRLVSSLRSADLAGLPQNLYAPQYTDLQIRVLNWSKDLQARRYLGVTPATHGKRQKAFDRLFGELEGLVRRVLTGR